MWVLSFQRLQLASLGQSHPNEERITAEHLSVAGNEVTCTQVRVGEHVSGPQEEV